MHLGGFVKPIFGTVLDDAEAIDPEITNAKEPTDMDCVKECFGKGLKWDSLFE